MTDIGSLGKPYSDGQVIVDYSESMGDFFVVQEGRIEIVGAAGGREIRLAICGQGEIVGEWAPEPNTRYAVQIRALGPARLLTIQRVLLLRRMQEDPSLAFRILETMSRRMANMTQRVLELATG